MSRRGPSPQVPARRASANALTALLTLAVIPACASSEPIEVAQGEADEVVDVVVLGDGFVRQGTRRVPREAFVLELRQRGRAMTPDQLNAFRVQVWFARDGGEATASDAEWLLGQLQIIGVGQAQVKFQP